jgi:hypothetical protein
MSMSDKPPSIHVQGRELIVRYQSAIDDSPSVDTIQSEDIVQIVLERVGSDVHWFLQHRAGWTLHFHGGFQGAATAISWLERFAGFSVPALGQIAGPGGEGTVVWSSE